MSLIGQVIGSDSLVAFDKTATIQTAPVDGTGMDAGHRDWDNPQTVGSIRVSLQPAGTEAMERAGLLGKAGVWQIYGEHFALLPATHRLVIDGRRYHIRDVRLWDSHVEATLELEGSVA